MTNHKAVTKLIPLFFVLAIVIGSVFCLAGCSANLNPEEENAAQDVETLIGILNHPDSFILIGDVLMVSADSEAEAPGEYTFIEYSAENSYGDRLDGLAMFKNHAYIGDLEDNTDTNANMSDTEIDTVIEIADTKLVVLRYRLGGGAETDHETYELVSGKTIAANLDIEFEPAQEA